MKQLGNKILEIRKQKGLSQETLSDMAGISLRTLQRIEKGESSPRGYTLKSVCNALDLDVEEIYNYGKEQDKGILLLMHLSALSYLIIPLGNIILPLIIWLTQRKKILHLHEHGVSILNFQITLSLATYSVFALLIWTGDMNLFYIFDSLYLFNAPGIIVICWFVNKNPLRQPYPALLPILKV